LYPEALRHAIATVPFGNKEGVSSADVDIHEVGWLVRQTIPNQDFANWKVKISRNRFMICPFVPFARHDVSDLLMVGMILMNQRSM